MSSCMQNEWKVSLRNKSEWTRDDSDTHSDREHISLTDVLCITGPSRGGATEMWGGRALRSYSGASWRVWEQGRLPIGHRRGLYWGVVWLPARPGPLCKWHCCQLTTTGELCLRWYFFLGFTPTMILFRQILMIYIIANKYMCAFISGCTVIQNHATCFVNICTPPLCEIKGNKCNLYAFSMYARLGVTHWMFLCFSTRCLTNCSIQSNEVPSGCATAC